MMSNQKHRAVQNRMVDFAEALDGLSPEDQFFYVQGLIAVNLPAETVAMVTDWAVDYRGRVLA